MAISISSQLRAKPVKCVPGLRGGRASSARLMAWTSQVLADTPACVAAASTAAWSDSGSRRVMRAEKTSSPPGAARPASRGGADVRLEGRDDPPHDSNFFIAVCAMTAQTGAPTFIYIPRAANVLKERATHIDRLRQELDTKDGWLRAAQEEHAPHSHRR